MLKIISFIIQFILNIKQKFRDPTYVFEFHSDFIFRPQSPPKKAQYKDRTNGQLTK